MVLFINKSPHTVLSKNRNCGCSACNFIPFLIQKPPPNHKNRLRQRNITSLKTATHFSWRTECFKRSKLGDGKISTFKRAASRFSVFLHCIRLPG